MKSNTCSDLGSNTTPVTPDTPAENRETRDIEWLLHWAFVTQAVESAISRNRGRLQGPGMSGTAMLANLMSLGVRVDGTGAGAAWVADNAINPDAMAIYEAVQELATVDQMTAGMVVHYAKTLTEPDWWPEVSYSWQPVHSPVTGRVEVGYTDPANRNGKFCPITLYPDPDQVEYDRKCYQQWVDGLNFLAEEVSRRLSEFTVTRANRAFQPWNPSR